MEFLIILIFVFIAIWIFNYYQVEKGNHQSAEKTYNDSYQFKTPKRETNKTCDPIKDLTSCQFDSDCSLCLNIFNRCITYSMETEYSQENVHILIPQGSFCSSIIENRDLICDPQVSEKIVIGTSLGYKYICRCKFPWLVTQKTIYEKCNVFKKCNNVGTLIPTSGEPINWICQCPKEYLSVSNKLMGPTCKPRSLEDSIKNGFIKHERLKPHPVYFDEKLGEEIFWNYDNRSVINDEIINGKYGDKYNARVKVWGIYSDDPEHPYFHTGSAPCLYVQPDNHDYIWNSTYKQVVIYAHEYKTNKENPRLGYLIEGDLIDEFATEIREKFQLPFPKLFEGHNVLVQGFVKHFRWFTKSEFSPLNDNCYPVWTRFLAKDDRDSEYATVNSEDVYYFQVKNCTNHRTENNGGVRAPLYNDIFLYDYYDMEESGGEQQPEACWAQYFAIINDQETNEIDFVPFYSRNHLWTEQRNKSVLLLTPGQQEGILIDDSDIANLILWHYASEGKTNIEIFQKK